MHFLLLLMLIPLESMALEICLPTQMHADQYSRIFQVKAKFLQMKLVMAKQNVTPVRVGLSKKCNQCVVIEGDSYIGGVIKEEFEEQKAKEMATLLEEKPLPPHFKLDVTLGRLYPDRKVGDKVFFNPLYKPFLRYPDHMQNVFYDKDDQPVYVTAKILNEKVMSYTFLYKDQKHSINQYIDEGVGCMFPYENEEAIKKLPNAPFYVKEDDEKKFIENFQILSIKRDFYWPEELKENP